MRKLKEDKKIRWKEDYTDKTSYLKEMYADLIGIGSYYRFYGKEVGGGDEWYVIVGPSGVHDSELKFFAGIRKLPDTWPAGGKKFDSLVDAFTYAFDTWGVPKPKNIAKYNARDLKELDKRVDKWKAERESKKSEDDKKEASMDKSSSLDKTSMAAAKTVKSPLLWNYNDFKDLFERSLRDHGSFSPQSFYENLISDAESALRSRGFDASGEDISGELFIKKYIDYLSSTNKTPTQVVDTPYSRGKVENIFDRKPMARPSAWLGENLPIKGAILDLSSGAGNTYQEIESDTFINNHDVKIVIAAMVSVIGREKRAEFIESASEIGLNIDEGELPLFQRSNFEEGIQCLRTQHVQSVNSYKEKYGQRDIPEEHYPVNTFIEYGRYESSTRLMHASPYTSKRNFDKMWNFGKDIYESEYFAENFSDYDVPAMIEFLNRNSRANKNISVEKAELLAKKLLDFKIGGSPTRRDPDRQTEISRIRAAFSGEILPIISRPDGQMIEIRMQEGQKTRTYESLGAWYAGSMNVTDGLAPERVIGGVVSGLSNVNDLLIYSSDLRLSKEEIIQRLSERNSISSTSLDPIVNYYGGMPDGQSIYPRDLYDASKQIDNCLSAYDVLAIFGSSSMDNSVVNKKYLLDNRDISANVRNQIIEASPVPGENGRDGSYISTVDAFAILWPENGIERSNDIITSAQQNTPGGLSPVMSSLGESINIKMLRNNSGITVPTVELDMYGYWKILKTLFGDMWGLRDNYPELYKRVLDNYFLPNHIEQEDIVGRIDGYEQMDDGAKLVAFEKALQEYVEERAGQGQLNSINDFVKIQRGQADELTFTQTASKFESRVDDMQKRVLAEIAKEVVLSGAPVVGANDSQSQEIRNSLAESLSFVLPVLDDRTKSYGAYTRNESLTPADVVNRDPNEPPIVLNPGTSVFGTDLMDANGNIMPSIVVDQTEQAVYNINYSHLTIDRKDNEDSYTATARRVSSLMAKNYSSSGLGDRVKVAKIDKIRSGTLSPSAIEDSYGESIQTTGGTVEKPVADEMITGAKSYKEFLHKVAMGWYPKVEGLPVTIGANGEVVLGFDVSEEALGVTGLDLSQNYISNNRGLENLVPVIEELHSSLGILDANLEFLTDRVISNGFWWGNDNDPGRKVLVNNIPVDVTNFADFGRAVRYFNSNTADGRQAANLAVMAARRTIKWCIIKDMRAGQTQEVIDQEVVVDARQHAEDIVDDNPREAHNIYNIDTLNNPETYEGIMSHISRLIAPDQEADQIEEVHEEIAEEESEEELGVEIDDEAEDMMRTFLSDDEDEEIEDVMDEEVAEALEEDSVENIGDEVVVTPAPADEFDQPLEEDDIPQGAPAEPTPSPAEPETSRGTIQRRNRPVVRRERPQRGRGQQPPQTRPQPQQPAGQEDDEFDLDLSDLLGGTTDHKKLFSSKRINMKSTLVRIAKLSIDMANRGKIDEAEELNKIIRQYIK